MGYLQIAAAPLTNFKKAIISIWFRVPSATLTAVSALTNSPVPRWSDSFNGVAFYPPMWKTIPLITFGSLETTIPGSSVGASLPISPSFIGIDCSVGPRLAVNLQMPNLGSFSAPPTAPQLEYRPACFFMSGSSGTQNCTVTADAWHHALISFDLTDSCSATYSDTIIHGGAPFQIAPGPTFSWALDDVSKVGISMNPSGGANWAPTYGSLADNHIIPNCLIAVLSGAGDEDGASVTWSSTNISSNGNPIGIPTSATFVDNAYDVVRGPLQFFTGVSADASDEAIRRLFIKADGTPENPSVAAAALGQNPKIKLIGSNNWKAGTNTGSLGNLTRTGTINDYTPGPLL